MRARLPVLALALAAAAGAEAHECKELSPPRKARVERRDCRPMPKPPEPERRQADRDGFIDLGNGTRVRVDGRVRVEGDVRR